MPTDPPISAVVAEPPIPVEEAIRSNSAELLISAGADASLNEDLALTLLKRTDLPGEVLERLSKNSSAMKSRKVKLTLVEHPKTPRHVSLPIVRHLFTFDLMHVTLTPGVPADVKAIADETLCNRMETITSGEKLTLAHRASGRVAAELLSDLEPRVIHAAMENSRLTEAQVIKALMASDASPVFVQAACHHARWSLRREVRIALLRSQYTPLARALEFVRTLPARLVKEVLRGSRLPANIKEHLLKNLNS